MFAAFCSVRNNGTLSFQLSAMSLPLPAGLSLVRSCGFDAENKVGWAVPGLGNRGELGGIPPSPQPLKALRGAGFAKSFCKILMSKSLEVKILTTLGLAPSQWGSPHYVWLNHDRANEIYS